MNQEQLVARRELVFIIPTTGETGRYYGEQIVSFNKVGVIIAVTHRTNMLMPWHLIVQFNFHNEDSSVSHDLRTL